MTRVMVTSVRSGQVSSVWAGCGLTTPSGSGMGSPWGIDLRPAEHLVHAIDQTIRHHVLELLRLVVNFVPPVPHDSDEEQLDHPMTPHNQRRELLAGLRQCDAGVRLVFDETRLRERLHHRRGRPGGNAERGREVAHGQESIRVAQRAYPEVNRLQVVLNRAGRQHLHVV